VRTHVDHRRARRSAYTYERVLERLRRLATAHVSGEICDDPDEELIEKTERIITKLFRYYFRPEVTGLENVPDEPSMLVGNHDGGYLPVDGICLGAAWHQHFGYKRPLIWLMHDFPFRISPRLTNFLSRCGVRPASRIWLRDAFDRGRSMFVYPGGAHEAFRPYVDRRRIELGHRTGFIAEALTRKVPIVPVVSVGAHETLFVISRGSWLAHKIPFVKRFRSDVLPLWIGLPWGIGFGPLPHLPLPAKIKVEVLPPIRLWEELGDDSTESPNLQAGLDLVRRRMQTAIDALYDARHYPILG